MVNGWNVHMSDQGVFPEVVWSDSKVDATGTKA